MSKRLFLLPLLFISSAVIGLSTFNIANADNKDVNIALVNIQKIEEDSSASKDMRKKMANKENELRQELLKRKNKLESDFKSLESKRAMLSTEELQKQAQKLEGDYQKLQIDEQKYGQIFEATKMIVFAEFQEYVKKATNKVANSKYDMVIPFGLALYVNDDKFDDITSKVVSEMEKISKTVNYEKAYKQAKEQMEKMMQSIKK